MVTKSLPLLVNILLTITETMYIVPVRCGCRSAALKGGYDEEAATVRGFWDWLVGSGWGGAGGQG
jgi:hypothetical protein